MKVKIGDTVYDPNVQPILLILDDCDKENISNMLPEATKFCIFPETWSEGAINKFMGENK